MKGANGLTFYICFGPYAGFRTEFNPNVVRVVLGWMSIAIVRYDIEVVLLKLINRIKG